MDQKQNRGNKSTSHRPKWATPWSLLPTVSRTSALTLMWTYPWINRSPKCSELCVSIRTIGMIRNHINHSAAELLTRSFLPDWTCAIHCFTASTKHRYNNSSDYKTLLPDLSGSPGDSLISHLSSNYFSDYQWNIESSSTSPCLHSIHLKSIPQ